MKICFVSPFSYTLLDPSFPLKHGGGEVQILTLARGLAEMGHGVTFVVFDVGQPDRQTFDGITAFETILSLYPGQKALIASGHAPESRGKAAKELGAGWLTKPYNPRTLARAVRDCLDGNT